ncbi:hypothetical protein HAX54_037336, partial [Datura stramonium]|nr:hypothetical protein [Datura stramonium]
WCTPDHYAWLTVGGPMVHPSGAGQTVPGSVNHMIQGVEEKPQVPRIKEDTMEHTEGEPEIQSEYRPTGHGEEEDLEHQGWQMGDPEESSKYDFLKSFEHNPGFHYDVLDDEDPTWL